jgi:uncharacterized protein (TIGR03067 family)
MVRLTRVALSVLLVACGATPAVGGDKKKSDKLAVEKALKRLQGTWEQVSVVADGQKELFAKGMAPLLTIRGDSYTIEAGGRVLERGTWKVEKVSKPAIFDLITAEGRTKGKTSRGIYEVSENELRTCIAVTDVNRPTEFTAKTDSGRAVAVYRRIQPVQPRP